MKTINLIKAKLIAKKYTNKEQDLNTINNAYKVELAYGFGGQPHLDFTAKSGGVVISVVPKDVEKL